MKKTGIRISVIIITFVIALIFFSKYYNQGTTDLTVDMSKPSLPLVYINLDGYKANEMHGYVTGMDCSTLRDTVTPVGEDRNVSFVIDKYDNGILDMKVELRSADGSRLIEDTALLHYNDYSDHIEASIQLKDLIDEGKEYNLLLILTLLDGKEVSYYTRVVQNGSAAAADKIGFVLDFCRKSLSKDNVSELSTYMEPNDDADNTTLGRVGINNSMNQLTWGPMKDPAIVGEPSVFIREIGDTMASVELRYLVREGPESKSVKYGNVTEYYRIRKTDTRFYLLSFSRTLNEIFVLDKSNCSEDRIDLGIQGKTPHIMESEGGEIIVFENEGRLYSYNVTDNKFIRLFAFFDSADDDLRSRYRGSDVKILNVEENGNVSFIVYGYMNRGIHEGYVGIEVYYYDSLLNTIEEQAFIPYDKSAEILKCDMDRLSFLNAGGDLFIFLDGVIYKVIPRLMDETIIARNVNEDTFFASNSQNVIVWQEPEKPGVEELFTDLSVMSLTRGETNVVKSRAGEYIRPIGFMEDDLIYGECRQGDLIYGELGDVIFPMNRVIIQSDTGEVLKKYDEEGIYVTSGVIDGNQMTLSRSVKQEDGSLTETTDDYITSKVEVKEGKNTIVYVNTEEYEKITQLKIKSEPDIKGMKLLTPKEVLYEGGRELDLESSEVKDRFLVYGDGNIVGIYDKPAKAVAYAYSIRGTVMDMYGNEIYRRGETVPRNQIMAITEKSVTDTKDSLAVCLDTMLSLMGVSRNTEFMLQNGQNAYDILSSNLENAYILNLTGCSLDVALYFVNRDIPVMAYMNDRTAMLIIGFNEQNIVVMDPVQGTIYKIGRKDAAELMEDNGNRFMTYAPADAE